MLCRKCGQTEATHNMMSGVFPILAPQLPICWAHL